MKSLNGPFKNGASGYRLAQPESIELESYPMTNTTNDEMKAELERLRNENEALKKTSAKGLSLKVSEKGGVSVYGLGRFPVTLYKEQWNKLLGMADDIRTFIQANDSKLKTKE